MTTPNTPASTMVNLCILPSDPSALCLSIPHFLYTLPTSLLSSLAIQSAPTSTTTALLWLPNIAQGDTSCALRSVLATYPSIRFVQLPMTGVDHFLGLMKEFAGVTWCCAKGCYSEVVAEHALSMTLTLLRRLPTLSGGVSVSGEAGEAGKVGESDSLFGKRVLIVGSGSIATALSALLKPFHCSIVYTRSTTTLDTLRCALPAAQIVFLTCPSTRQTHNLFSAPLLSKLHPTAVLINVARPEIIHTPDLLSLLKTAHIRAALDVIDTSQVDNKDVETLVKHGKLLLTDHQAVPPKLIPRLLGDRLRWNLQVLVGEKEGWKGQVNAEKGY